MNSLPRFCVSSYFLLLLLTSPFLKIQILNRPQIHKFLSCVFISLYGSRRRKWSTNLRSPRGIPLYMVSRGFSLQK